MSGVDCWPSDVDWSSAEFSEFLTADSPESSGADEVEEDCTCSGGGWSMLKAVSCSTASFFAVSSGFVEARFGLVKE